LARAAASLRALPLVAPQVAGSKEHREKLKDASYADDSDWFVVVRNNPKVSPEGQCPRNVIVKSDCCDPVDLPHANTHIHEGMEGTETLDDWNPFRGASCAFRNRFS
jgi:hypothetical protein